jgi:disulfide bond formation protein DsbB
LLSAAWAAALVSTFAALFIGEVMGMTPCQLCWYQRILMFPLAVMLGMAAYCNDRRGAAFAAIAVLLLFYLKKSAHENQ